MMHDAHSKLGKRWQGSRKGIYNPVSITALADTGCQTCTISQDMLPSLNCPIEYLIPTRHRIIGITDTSLGIVGAIMLRINVHKKTTRQMVFVSSKVKGFFLSESALKDLEIVDETFPGTKSNAARTATSPSPCSCPQRSVTPDRPQVLHTRQCT